MVNERRVSIDVERALTVRVARCVPGLDGLQRSERLSHRGAATKRPSQSNYRSLRESRCIYARHRGSPEAHP